MRVNEEHETFKLNGEPNRAYQSGKLQAFFEELARRVKSKTDSAEKYIERMKEKGILE